MPDEKVDTAADLQAAKDKLAKAEAAHADAVAASAGPRHPTQVIADFFDAVTMRLGNRPDLRVLADEFREVSEAFETPAKE